MIGNAQARATATVAVKDLAVAGKFYEGTLGLKRVEVPEEEVLVYEAGGSKLLVYRSQHAGTNQATGVTWSVGRDIEGVVTKLRDKGVRFEHYDMPGGDREGDVHVFGALRTAWFKDPDGNIHSLTNE
jgi:catechol 2,3-dioxygenase-like lactoylglutathione lyase family enzyme